MSSLIPGNRWLWAIPLLLLALTFGGRRLNYLPVQVDEAATLMSAGARTFGPLTPLEAIAAQSVRWPDQAFGQVVLINTWGKLVGWSIVSLRALSWLAGILTLALVYRVATACLSRRAALVALLLLSTSVMFTTYLFVARVFTMVALCSTLTLWCYYRAAMQPGAADRRYLAGLFLGAAGLLHSHWFAALLPAAICVLHVLFVRKDRRWWRVSLALVAAFLTVLPALEIFLEGIAFNQTRFAANPVGLSAPELAAQLIKVLSNNIVLLPDRAAWPALASLLTLLLLLAWRRARGKTGDSFPWLAAMSSLLFILLAIVVNEGVARVILHRRMRYFMAVWPPLATLGGHVFHALGRSRPALAHWLLAGFVSVSLFVGLRTPWYLSIDYFWLPPLHLADQQLVTNWRDGDWLLQEREVVPATGRIGEYYSSVLDYPGFRFSPEDQPEAVLAEPGDRSRVWLLASARGSDVEKGLMQDRVFCRRYVDREHIVLTLYARHRADCVRD